jgi:hypothetical protein
MVRGRNCWKYLSVCLESIFRELDGAFVSIDNPQTCSERDILACTHHDNFDSVITGEHLGPARNMWVGLNLIGDRLRIAGEDVVCIVDADDVLLPGAGDAVRKAYTDHPNALATYGSYVKRSVGRKTKISRPYPDGADVRVHPWRGSHLKTFKYKLWKHMKSDCFKDKNGAWLTSASDLALMFPIMEMAGLDRCVHISKPVYLWSDKTPFTCSKLDQERCEKIVRAKPRFERIEL